MRDLAKLACYVLSWMIGIVFVCSVFTLMIVIAGHLVNLIAIAIGLAP